MTACPSKVVQQSEICEHFGLREYSLKKPFSLLVDGGIISSNIGRHGGHALKRSPKTVTLDEIVKLLERDFHLVPALAPGENGEPLCPNAMYHFAFERAVKAFFHELSDFTIAELAGDPYTLQLLGIPDLRRDVS